MRDYNQFFVGVALALTFGGSGCNSDSSPQNPPPFDPHPLYTSDVAAFANIDSAAVATFDSAHNQLFSKMFGGTDASSVEQYYNARIHYAFSDTDLKGALLYGMQNTYTGWYADPTASAPDPSQHFVLGALNYGTGWWIEATLENSEATLVMGDQTIPIDSTRTGVMLFGAGYVPTETTSSGKTINVPVVYRQSILIHEARHSDCTGGLPESEIEIMRSAQSEEDFLKQIPLPHCGHTHITCASGTYQGIAACDAERYGAYKIGAEYEESQIDSASDEITKKFLQMTAIDFESRFVDTGFTAPDELEPNMTSAGRL
jgi:hypothetical protein